MNTDYLVCIGNATVIS